jgi:hypothetical protein
MREVSIYLLGIFIGIIIGIGWAIAYFHSL